MTFAPSTTEISRCLTIQESREWLAIALVYGGLAILIALFVWPWLTLEPPMIHAEQSWMWRAALAGAMSVPVAFAVLVIWRDDE